MIARRGLMLVISSPSGAGKSTLSRRLLATDSNIGMSVSVTTRPKRANEIDGTDYIFVTPERFDALVDRVAAEIGDMSGENRTDKVWDGVLRFAN